HVLIAPFEQLIVAIALASRCQLASEGLIVSLLRFSPQSGYARPFANRSLRRSKLHGFRESKSVAGVGAPAIRWCASRRVPRGRRWLFQFHGTKVKVRRLPSGEGVHGLQINPPESNVRQKGYSKRREPSTQWRRRLSKTAPQRLRAEPQASVLFHQTNRSSLSKMDL